MFKTLHQGPYTLSKTTLRKTELLTHHLRNPLDKALALHHHLKEHVPYDRGDERSMRNAEEAYLEGGNCAEQSFLYIAMARASNLTAGYTSIIINCDGKDYREHSTGHACAHVKIGQKKILVDQAFREFDINHIKHKQLNDKEVYNLYNSLANKKSVLPPPKKRSKLKTIIFIMTLITAIASSLQIYSVIDKNHWPQKTYKIIQRIID